MRAQLCDKSEFEALILAFRSTILPYSMVEDELQTLKNNRERRENVLKNVYPFGITNEFTYCKFIRFDSTTVMFALKVEVGQLFVPIKTTE